MSSAIGHHRLQNRKYDARIPLYATNGPCLINREEPTRVESCQARCRSESYCATVESTPTRDRETCRGKGAGESLHHVKISTHPALLFFSASVRARYASSSTCNPTKFVLVVKKSEMFRFGERLHLTVHKNAKTNTYNRYEGDHGDQTHV